MSKAVSRGQALDVSARVGTQVDWDEIDGTRLQREVINLTPKEFGRRFTLFIKNGARPHLLGSFRVVPQPFNPVEFLGKGWSLIPEEHDARCDALTAVDLVKTDFVTCLKEGEPDISGEEKLKRMKASKNIRLGATIFSGLWAEYAVKEEMSMLECLFQAYGITCLDFFGDVLLHPKSGRGVLYFHRVGNGVWIGRCGWLGSSHGVSNSSASLADKHLS